MTRESERKRLVELISDTNELCQVKKAMEKGKQPSCKGCKYEHNYDCHIERIADNLLANGIVVPPVKVGNDVYIVTEIAKTIQKVKVIGIWQGEHQYSIITEVGTIHTNSIGKTVFPTREEAEKMLKGEGK